MSHGRRWRDAAESMQVVASVKDTCCAVCTRRDGCQILSMDLTRRVPKTWIVVHEDGKQTRGWCRSLREGIECEGGDEA